MSKEKYIFQFSKLTSERMRDELLKMTPPKQTRTPYIRSSVLVAEELLTNPYPNKDIEIIIDCTGESVWVFDHAHQITHEYKKHLSHYHTQEGTILPIYSQLKDKIKQHLLDVVNKYEDMENEVPDLVINNGQISFNCSEGYFWDAEEMQVSIEDYIPCLLTPNEAILSAAALENIGNGDIRAGGMAVQMLNTTARVEL